MTILKRAGTALVTGAALAGMLALSASCRGRGDQRAGRGDLDRQAGRGHHGQGREDHADGQEHRLAT